METKEKKQRQTLSAGELKPKLLIKSDGTIEAYVREGILPQPVEITDDGNMLFDKQEILDLLGVKSLEEPFINAKEAAKILGCNEVTVTLNARKGRIPHYFLKNAQGNRKLYLRSEIEAAKKYTIRWSTEFANHIAKEKRMKDILAGLIGTRIDLLPEPESKVLYCIMVKDMTVKETAEKNSLNPYYVRFAFDRAARRMISKLHTLNERLEKVRQIEQENQTLKNRLEPFLQEEERLRAIQEEEMRKAALPEALRSTLAMKINESELSKRIQNCCKYADILTVEDLVRLSRNRFLGIRNAGEKCASEVDQFLLSHGLSWSMEV